jgi:hypothetical protein
MFKTFYKKVEEKNCSLSLFSPSISFIAFFKGHLKKQKNKQESVGCFYVGLRFFGLFCKMLLRLILTPPARYQHPHDTNNPPVGRWGCTGQL